MPSRIHKGRNGTRSLLALALLLSVLAVDSVARAEETRLLLQSAQRSATLDLAQLQALGSETVEVRWHRGERVESATFTGVSARVLLAQLGLPAGEPLRGNWLQGVVTAVAEDGYRVAFGAGEFESTLTGRRVLVAWARNGMPLSPSEGPLRLVIEGDARPSRSVRQLTRLQLVPAVEPRTQ
jgi:hypothetical protein